MRIPGGLVAGLDSSARIFGTIENPVFKIEDVR
jgi:hypothetical protein